MRTTTLTTALAGLAALALAGLPAGCSSDPTRGYSCEPLHRENIHTVAVPIWQRANKVYRRDLEFRLTESLIKRIELDTPYKVTDKSRADTLLEGTIESVDQRVLSFNPDNGDPRDIEMRIVVSFKWTDLRTGEVLVDRKKFTSAAVYYPSRDSLFESSSQPPTAPLNEDFFTGSADALNRMAELIVETMEKPW